MMRLIETRRILASVILTLWAGMSPLAATAQNLTQGTTTNPTQTANETVSLMVGDIFEVLPTSDIQNPSYSWILTQDRTFIQAGRAPTFRVRLVQPGTYTLIAEIDSQDLSQRITRTFTIVAQPRPLGKIGTNQQNGTGTMVATNGSGTSLVTTDPQTSNSGNAVLGDNQQLIKLTPVNPDLTPLSLDVNTAVDSNGDGNPSNDVDNQDTFFQSYASPLYVWFASPITTRSMAVTTIENGNAVTQNIEVDNLAYAQQNGLLVSPVSIVTTKTSDSTYNFTPQFTTSQTPQSTLLYHWSFGDGQESLLMNPSHTYASNGTYPVHLQVSDLVNGSQVAVADTQVIVQGSQAGTGSTAQTSSAATSQAASASSGGGLAGSLGSLLWLVLIFVIFVVIGLIVTFIISKLRRGRPLDETFAELEKNIVGKEQEEKKAPEPLTITPAANKPIPTQADVVKREEARTPPNPVAQTPRIEEAAAPSWLRKGLANQTESEPKKESAPAPQSPQTQPAPKPATPPMPVTPKPDTPVVQPKPAAQPAPKPTPAPQLQQTSPTPRPAPVSAPQPTATQQAPMPAWLQPNENTSAPQPSAPKPQQQQPAPASKPETPTPQPQPTPTPKPATPSPTSAPKPMPTPAPQPQAPVQPKPTPAPEPQKPATPPMPVVTPTPVTPAPQPKPVPAQEPQAPKPTPSQMPAAPKQDLPPVPAPKPVAPQEAKPTPEPKLATPSVDFAPKQETPAPQQVIPPPPQPVKPAETAQTDNPIAIIRADSIEEQKKDEPQQNA